MDSDEGATTNRRKGRRVDVYLHPAAAEEFEQLSGVAGISIGEAFRGALSLYKQAVSGCGGRGGRTLFC